jgi:hypothetical protein
LASSINLRDDANKEKWLKFLAECKTKEVITVLAGTFETCKISESDQTTWFGNVPTGLVKAEFNRKGYLDSRVDGAYCSVEKPQTWELQSFAH